MTHHKTRRILNETAFPLAAALMAILFASLPAIAQSGNLALGRSVTRSSDVSSGRAPNAVDGNAATFWQPLMSDRQDDSMVWLGVDLGGATPFNKIVLKFRTNVANVNGFRLLTSNDNATWQPAFSKFRPDQTFASIDESMFPDVTARFARVEIVLGNPTANFQLNELELYSSTPSLSRVFFTAADGRALAPAETITLSAGASDQLTLRGRLTNGQDVTLENATVTMSSNKPAIASVTPTGADAAIAALQQGDLAAQQPPTAQNYAIGHVGRKVNGFAPNSQDPLPRQDGWWESLNQSVEPRSLYLRQLTDRLGADAAQRIERTTVGGDALDTPRVEPDLPLTKGIKIDNHKLAGFSPTVFEYTVELPAGTTQVPEVRPHDSRHRYQTLPATHLNGKTVLILWDKHDASKSVRYTIRFVTPTP